MSLTRTAEYDTGYGSKRGKFDENYEANIPPSRVVHVRNVPDGISEQEIQSAFGLYGKVSFVMILTQKRQAFVEYEDMSGSQNVVTQSAGNPLQLQGRRVYVTFSKSQEIDRNHSSLLKAGQHGRQPYGQAYTGQFGQVYGGFATRDPGQPTNILLLTIMNAVFPINVEIIYSICSPLGNVVRIVIFRKTGVQALVEFDSVAAAVTARQSLDGADIYHGCCTLKIDFSKTPRLNVRKNDDQTWDYTMAYGQMAGYDQSYGQDNRYGMGGPQVAGMMGGAGAGGPCVLMVYGLTNEVLNCDKVFNLFCLYGNVTKIKFLPNKQGSAMVQMADANSASVALQHINNTTLFDTTINVSKAKAPSIAGMSNSSCPDGTPSVVDYTTSQLNRFSRPSLKNRIYRPSPVLHFFNAPPDITTEALKSEFTRLNAPEVVDIKIFDKVEGAKSASGLLEYASIEDGIKAVTLVNHTLLHGQTGGDFTFKLAFSAASHANKDAPVNKEEKSTTATSTVADDAASVATAGPAIIAEETENIIVETATPETDSKATEKPESTETTDIIEDAKEQQVIE